MYLLLTADNSFLAELCYRGYNLYTIYKATIFCVELILYTK